MELSEQAIEELAPIGGLPVSVFAAGAVEGASSSPRCRRSPRSQCRAAGWSWTRPGTLRRRAGWRSASRPANPRWTSPGPTGPTSPTATTTSTGSAPPHPCCRARFRQLTPQHSDRSDRSDPATGQSFAKQRTSTAYPRMAPHARGRSVPPGAAGSTNRPQVQRGARPFTPRDTSARDIQAEREQPHPTHKPRSSTGPPARPREAGPAQQAKQHRRRAAARTRRTDSSHSTRRGRPDGTRTGRTPDPATGAKRSRDGGGVQTPHNKPGPGPRTADRGRPPSRPRRSAQPDSGPGASGGTGGSGRWRGPGGVSCRAVP